MSERYCIVGLGNPGEKYAWTRHNIGFLILEKLAQEWNVTLKTSSMFQAIVGQHRTQDMAVTLAMPTTFMNESGRAVHKLVKDEVILERVLVIYDDFHLPFGHIRLREQGSAGGHNGIKSIINHLGTQEFSRLRLGVGQPRSLEQAADYVLSDFSTDERKEIPEIIDHAIECIQVWLTQGMKPAMDRFNRNDQEGK